MSARSNRDEIKKAADAREAAENLAKQAAVAAVAQAKAKYLDDKRKAGDEAHEQAKAAKQALVRKAANRRRRLRRKLNRGGRPSRAVVQGDGSYTRARAELRARHIQPAFDHLVRVQDPATLVEFKAQLERHTARRDAAVEAGDSASLAVENEQISLVTASMLTLLDPATLENAKVALKAAKAEVKQALVELFGREVAS